MLKLKERKTKYNDIDQAMIDSEFERLEVLKKKQSELGLGRPTVVMNKLAEKLKLAQFAKQFTPVDKPEFTEFEGGHVEVPLKGKSTWDSKVDILPDKVLVALDSSAEKIVCRLEGATHSAPVPLIPNAIQELAAKAKEVIPTVKFHMAFVPQWQFDPKADPILLAEVAGDWFQVGSWGGDVDVLSEYIVSKL